MHVTARRQPKCVWQENLWTWFRSLSYSYPYGYTTYQLPSHPPRDPHTVNTTTIRAHVVLEIETPRCTSPAGWPIPVRWRAPKLDVRTYAPVAGDGEREQQHHCGRTGAAAAHPIPRSLRNKISKVENARGYNKGGAG